ncbi:MAG: hypothetical protein U5Q44_05000 [Dehalococcoidia bacterium]|nr:hypothetical protein [Dehalococcoidia bacterium]
MSLARSVFDFSLPEARLRAFLVLLAAALISPNIGMPEPLPALRLEQILLAAYLPSFGYYLWHNRPAWRIGLIDFALAAFAGAMALTLVVAPIVVADVGRSFRDVFEIARVAEYWLLFRLGLTVVPDYRTLRATTGLMLAGIVGLAAFAFVQYLAPGGFNDSITSMWTTEHNLEGLIRRGRVLGTTGNANYYGILGGFFLVLALGVVLFRQRIGPAWTAWLAPAAALAATLSIVMSQSRTAAFAMLGAMFLGLVLVAIQKRKGPAYGQAIGIFLVSVIISVTFVEVVPPQFGTFHERFAPASLTEDSSVSIRLSKWRSVFQGLFESQPDFCQGEPLETRPIAGGHDIATDTGAPTADPEALARDEERKEDVATIAGGVVDYYCAEGHWPAAEPLGEALVPAHLAELPADPATGEPYLSYITGGGISIGAELENPADPEGPVYTLSTLPNFLLNPSFESGNSQPNQWTTTGSGGETDAVADVAPGGLFGENAAEVEFPPGGNLRQNVVYEFPLDTPHVAGAWFRSISGEAEEVQIYLVAQTTGGEERDPFAQEVFTVPADGRWVYRSLDFTTPEEDRIHLLRYMIRTQHEGDPATVEIDGAMLTRGPFPLSFHRTQDVDPASLSPDDLPNLSDSPLLGVGPRHNYNLGSVDNEYVLVLERYGLLGTIAYLAVWAGAFIAAWLAWRRGGPLVSVLALAMLVFIVALAVFNVAAGSFYHFQIMAVYWLLIGLLLRAAQDGCRGDELP